MANKSLTDLTARTSTADSDLIHVNSDGTDYKQTKVDFLSNVPVYIDFNITQLITTQIDNISGHREYFGAISVSNSTANQTATGAPTTSSGMIEVIAFSANNKIVYYHAIGQYDNIYCKRKVNGTWASGWTKMPNAADITKSSVTATPHASITANRLSAYRVGDLVTVSFNMDSGVEFATNSNLVQLGYGAPALIDFTCMNVTDGTPFQLYMTSGGMIRNGATLPSGKRLIGCFSYAVG